MVVVFGLPVAPMSSSSCAGRRHKEGMNGFGINSILSFRPRSVRFFCFCPYVAFGTNGALIEPRQVYCFNPMEEFERVKTAKVFFRENVRMPLHQNP